MCNSCLWTWTSQLSIPQWFFSGPVGRASCRESPPCRESFLQGKQLDVGLWVPRSMEPHSSSPVAPACKLAQCITVACRLQSTPVPASPMEIYTQTPQTHLCRMASAQVSLKTCRSRTTESTCQVALTYPTEWQLPKLFVLLRWVLLGLKYHFWNYSNPEVLNQPPHPAGAEWCSSSSRDSPEPKLHYVL